MNASDLPSIGALLFMFVSGAILSFLASREYVVRRLTAQARGHAELVKVIRLKHDAALEDIGAKAVQGCVFHFKRGVAHGRMANANGKN